MAKAPTEPGGSHIRPGSTDPASATPSNPPPRFPGSGVKTGLLTIGIAAGTTLLMVIVVVAIVTSQPDSTMSTTAKPQDNAASSSYEPPRDAATPSLNAKADIQGDGTYSIGSELAAGAYTAAVPKDSTLCYWERLKGTNNRFEDIIANGVGEAGQKVTVTIEDKDKAFTTRGCGPWTRR